MDRSINVGPLRAYMYHDYKREDKPDRGPIYAGVRLKNRGFEVTL